MFVPEEFLERAGAWSDLKRWERRELGQALRGLGLSYREIAEIIPVAKGTLSGWCRDIRLTDEQEARLRTTRPALATRIAVGARRRDSALARTGAIRADARDEAAMLVRDVAWVAGTVAYWAEGDKRGKDIRFSNSDPRMINLFIDWVDAYLGIPRERLTIALHLHAGQSEAERVNFWADATGLRLDQFRKTFFKQEGTGHRKNVLYNGTATVRVTRSGDLLHRVLGWIDGLRTMVPLR